MEKFNDIAQLIAYVEATTMDADRKAAILQDIDGFRDEDASKIAEMIGLEESEIRNQMDEVNAEFGPAKDQLVNIKDQAYTEGQKQLMHGLVDLKEKKGHNKDEHDLEDLRVKINQM